MPARPPIRRPGISRLKLPGHHDFDDQLWPVNIALLVFSGFVGGLIIAYSDPTWDAEFWWRNVYVRLASLIVTVGLFIWLSFWLGGKRGRRFQLAAVLSIFLHALLGWQLVESKLQHRPRDLPLARVPDPNHFEATYLPDLYAENEPLQDFEKPVEVLPTQQMPEPLARAETKPFAFKPPQPVLEPNKFPQEAVQIPQTVIARAEPAAPKRAPKPSKLSRSETTAPQTALESIKATPQPVKAAAPQQALQPQATPRERTAEMPAVDPNSQAPAPTKTPEPLQLAAANPRAQQSAEQSITNRAAQLPRANNTPLHMPSAEVTEPTPTAKGNDAASQLTANVANTSKSSAAPQLNQPELARDSTTSDKPSPAPAPTKAPPRPDSTAIARVDAPLAPARQSNNTTAAATQAENVQGPGISGTPGDTALAANTKSAERGSTGAAVNPNSLAAPGDNSAAKSENNPGAAGVAAATRGEPGAAGAAPARDGSPIGLGNRPIARGQAQALAESIKLPELGGSGADTNVGGSKGQLAGPAGAGTAGRSSSAPGQSISPNIGSGGSGSDGNAGDQPAGGAAQPAAATTALGNAATPRRDALARNSGTGGGGTGGPAIERALDVPNAERAGNLGDGSGTSFGGTSLNATASAGSKRADSRAPIGSIAGPGGGNGNGLGAGSTDAGGTSAGTAATAANSGAGSGGLGNGRGSGIGNGNQGSGRGTLGRGTSGNGNQLALNDTRAQDIPGGGANGSGNGSGNGTGTGTGNGSGSGTGSGNASGSGSIVASGVGGGRGKSSATIDGAGFALAGNGFGSGGQGDGQGGNGTGQGTGNSGTGTGSGTSGNGNGGTNGNGSGGNGQGGNGQGGNGRGGNGSGEGEGGNGGTGTYGIPGGIASVANLQNTGTGGIPGSGTGLQIGRSNSGGNGGGNGAVGTMAADIAPRGGGSATNGNGTGDGSGIGTGNGTPGSPDGIAGAPLAATSGGRGRQVAGLPGPAVSGPFGAIAGEPGSGDTVDSTYGSGTLAAPTRASGTGGTEQLVAMSGGNLARSRGATIGAGTETADLPSMPSLPTSGEPGAPAAATTLQPGGLTGPTTAKSRQSVNVQIEVASSDTGGLGDHYSPTVGTVQPLARQESAVISNTAARFLNRTASGASAIDGQVREAAPAFGKRIRSSNLEPEIELGLKFVASAQNADGSWNLRSFPGATTSDVADRTSPTAATGLSLLAFLGAGYDHFGDEYQKNVALGLAYLVEHQRPDGDLYVISPRVPNDPYALYSHGIATIALCEAYGMTGDEKLKEPAQRAISYIEKAQDKKLGGWRYNAGNGTDTSVTGWQLMALKSGELAKLKVNPQTYDGVRKWLAAAEAKGPGKNSSDAAQYVYDPNAVNDAHWNRSAGRLPTPATTSMGLLMRMYLGWDRENPDLQRGAKILLDNPPQLGTTAQQKRNTYYWYYASQVMFHMQGDAWREWNQKLRPLLVSTQVKTGVAAGSWDPGGTIPDRWSKQGGRLYVTTMNLLSLEVQHRYLPIYETISQDK